MCRGVYRDITGQRFGKLTVLDGKAKRKGCVICKCDCGIIKEVLKSSLLSGHTKSCGNAGCRTRTNKKSEIHSTPVSYGMSDKSFENEERVIDINKVYKKMYEINKKPSISKRNSSGYTGVMWDKRNRIWKAMIGFKGEKIYLGGFKLFDKAVQARKEAENLLFAPAVINMRKMRNAI